MKTNIIYKIRRKCQILALKLTSAEFMSKVYYRIVLKKRLDLKNPKTFNEKLQWLKLYEWPNNPIAIRCGDKYEVRGYLEEKGMSEYLNELIGVWDNVDDIDWDSLPEQFALKCTHGCAYNIICPSKKELDIEQSKKQLKKWMNEDFGKFNVEPHYSKMKPKIICEKFLGGDMIDYKFFCFNGKMRFMCISQRSTSGDDLRITYFDIDGKRAPFYRADVPSYDKAELPDKYEQMKQLSEQLAQGLPFIRVDWFEVGGKIYFGEMTFTPGGALNKIEPYKYDEMFGNELDISNVMTK